MGVPHIHQIVQSVEVHLTRPVRKPLDARRERRVPGDVALREVVPGVQRRRLVRVEPADARRHDRVLALHQTNDLDARLAHVCLRWRRALMASRQSPIVCTTPHDDLDHLRVMRRRFGAIQRFVRVLVGVVEP